MTAPTVSERQHRRKADDGDPDEAVYFVSHSVNYHEDPSCRKLTTSRTRVTEMRRSDVITRTRRVPCLTCTIPDERNQSDSGGRPETRFADLIETEAETEDNVAKMD